MEVVAGALRKERPALFLISSVIPILAVLLLFPSSGATLECFSCNSKTNDSCSDNWSKYKVTCPTESTGCRKWWFFFTLNDETHERVARSCGDSVTSNKCYKNIGTSGSFFSREVCECMADSCNSASNVKVNSILIGSVVLFMVIILLGKLY